MALSRLRSFWRNLRHRDRVERDLDDEMQATLDLLIDEKIAAGVEPREARRRAMIELNRIEPIKEQVRDVRAGHADRHTDSGREVRVAAHAPLARASPLAAILTLALRHRRQHGDVHDAECHRPEAAADRRSRTSSWRSCRSTPAARIARHRCPRSPNCATGRSIISARISAGWSFRSSPTTPRCRRRRRSSPASVSTRSAIAPILGRGLTEADAPILRRGRACRGDQPSAVDHHLRQRPGGARPSRCSSNNVPVTIVGVLPRGFIGLEIDTGVDIFTPFDAVLPAARGRRQLASYLLGRLRPGVTIEAATAEIEARWPAAARSGAAGQHGADRADAVDGFEAAPDLAGHRECRASANAIRSH